MDLDEMSKKLLEEESENWPDGLNESRPVLKKMPADIKASLKEAIAQAKDDAEAPKERSLSRRLLPFAAAAVLPLVFGLGFLFTRALEAPLLTLNTNYLRNDFRIHMTNTHLWKEGQVIALGPRGRLAFDVGRETLYFQGPGRFKILKARGGDSLLFRLKVEKGLLALTSTGRSNISPNLILETDARRYHLNGTSAVLNVGGGRENLLVLDGSFRAVSGETTRLVSAGEALSVDGGGIPLPRPLTPEERNKAKRFKAKLLRIVSGQLTLDRDLRFETTEALFKHYGAISRVVLNDERDFLGFVTSVGDFYEIHTVSGVLKLQNKDIKTITLLKSK